MGLLNKKKVKNMTRNFESTLFNGPKIDTSKPPTNGKKRIVIAWNEHPAESAIAGIHARRVANILSKKYGDLYEVILHKIPFAQTNIGIVRSEKDVKSKRTALSEQKESQAVATELAKHYLADKCYNFHTTSFKVLRVKPNKDPESYGTYVFRGGIFDSIAHSLGIELQFYPGFNKSGVVIELPANYERQPKRVIEKYKKIKKHILPPFMSIFSTISPLVDASLKKEYQDETTKLKLPFSHPTISRKIAEEIHHQM